jgi:hypothetical protein
VNPSQEPVSPGLSPADRAPWPIDQEPPPSTAPALPSGAPYPPADPGEGFHCYPGGTHDGPTRRRWRRTVVVCALIVPTVATLGIPFGLLWSWLSPSVPVLQTARSGVVVNDSSPEQFVAADAWFAILGFGFGVLVAVAAWLLLRRDRGPGLLLGAVLGALAAAPIAWQVGRIPGLSGYQRWLDSAQAGDTFHRPPDLHAYGALLVPGFAAVIVCTLLAGWSNDPDLELPGARPGYGNNAGAGEHAPADRISWGSPGAPDRTAAPAPPVPGSTTPPHG